MKPQLPPKGASTHHRNTAKTIFKPVATLIFTKREDNAQALLVALICIIPDKLLKLHFCMFNLEFTDCTFAVAKFYSANLLI